MKTVLPYRIIIPFLRIILLPFLGQAQEGVFHTQTCKERLQGTWKLTEARKRSGKFTSELEGIILKFEGDTLYWIDAIHYDTLSGVCFAWTDIKEITKSFKDDPYCDDTDDDPDNDCTYTYETRLVQQNSMAADLRSNENFDVKKVEWKNFTLNNNEIITLHREKNAKYRLVFIRIDNE